MVLVANGDEDAFGTIVKKYLPKALSYAGRFIGVDPEEVAQETFVRMWKYAPLWDASKGNLTTWFYSVLSNVCYTCLKKKRSKRGEVELKGDFPREGYDIEEILIQKQRESRIRETIAYLNEREQRIIILKYFEGHSDKDIATIMGTTVKAVETLLVRTRKKLKRFYKE